MFRTNLYFGHLLSFCLLCGIAEGWLWNKKSPVVRVCIGFGVFIALYVGFSLVPDDAKWDYPPLIRWLIVAVMAIRFILRWCEKREDETGYKD